MAVTNTSATAGPYVGNGLTTMFPFSFACKKADEVAVYVDGLKLLTGFSVAIDTSDYQGGSVTFAVAPAAGAVVALMSNPDFRISTQLTDASGAFLRQAIQDELDRGVIRDVALRADLGRAIQLPVGEGVDDLPPAESRANKVLGFDADGNLTLLTISTSGVETPPPASTILTPTVFTDSLVTTARSGYIETSALARTVFTTTATSLTIHGYTSLYSAFADKTWASLAVYSNGVYVGSAKPTADGMFTDTITLPAGFKTVEIINGIQSKPSSLIGTYLVSVEANAGMTQTFPSSAAKTCFLVDSIGVGTNAILPSKNGYIGLLRRATSDNLLVYGWGYGKLADVAADTSALAGQLAAAGVTRLVVALGTNDYGLNGQTAASFQTQLAALVDAFRAAVPTGTVVGLTPLNRATETANSLGSTLGAYRTAYANVDASRSWMALIDGTTLLSASEMADGLHPPTYGHFKIYQQVGPLLGYTLPTPLPFFTSDNAKVTDQSSGVYRIEKTSGGASFNAGAFAIASQAGDFSYSFVPQALQDTVVGITTGSPSASDSYLDMLYGLYIEGTSGVLRGQDGSTTTPNLGTYAGGDRLWIDRTGTTLTFRKGATFAGGSTLRTIPGVSGTVTLDMSLFTVGGQLDVSIGGGGLTGGGGGTDPAFTVANGPDTNGSVTDLGSGVYRATKTGGGAAFNAGFYSPAYSGDFTFKAIANQVGDIMLGLNTAASSGSGFNDMGGQIYLDGSGNIQSYTGGSTTGTIGSYASGDTFWIVRSGSSVTIKKGASLGSASTLRTFTLAGSVALDVSMFVVGNTIDLSKTA